MLFWWLHMQYTGYTLSIRYKINFRFQLEVEDSDLKLIILNRTCHILQQVQIGRKKFEFSKFFQKKENLSRYIYFTVRSSKTHNIITTSSIDSALPAQIVYFRYKCKIIFHVFIPTKHNLRLKRKMNGQKLHIIPINVYFWLS